MEISEGEIHESPGINAFGSLIAGELSGEDENIDVTGEVRNFRKIIYISSHLSASTWILKPEQGVFTSATVPNLKKNQT